jgi:hypothetical protein
LGFLLVHTLGHLEQSQFFRRIDRRRGANDFGS